MGDRLELITRRLRDEGDKMSLFFRALQPADWELQIYPGDMGEPWSLRHLLAHQLSAERGFHLLALGILQGGEGSPVGMNIDAFNAREVIGLENRSPAGLLDSLLAARQQNIDLLQSLAEADLDREGRHPFFGWTTLEKLFKLIYRHNMLHIRDVKRVMG